MMSREDLPQPPQMPEDPSVRPEGRVVRPAGYNQPEGPPWYDAASSGDPLAYDPSRYSDPSPYDGGPNPSAGSEADRFARDDWVDPTPPPPPHTSAPPNPNVEYRSDRQPDEEPQETYRDKVAKLTLEARKNEKEFLIKSIAQTKYDLHVTANKPTHYVNSLTGDQADLNTLLSVESEEQDSTLREALDRKLAALEAIATEQINIAQAREKANQPGKLAKLAEGFQKVFTKKWVRAGLPAAAVAGAGVAIAVTGGAAALPLAALAAKAGIGAASGAIVSGGVSAVAGASRAKAARAEANNVYATTQRANDQLREINLDSQGLLVKPDDLDHKISEKELAKLSLMTDGPDKEKSVAIARADAFMASMNSKLAQTAIEANIQNIEARKVAMRENLVKRMLAGAWRGALGGIAFGTIMNAVSGAEAAAAGLDTHPANVDPTPTTPVKASALASPEATAAPTPEATNGAPIDAAAADAAERAAQRGVPAPAEAQAGVPDSGAGEIGDTRPSGTETGGDLPPLTQEQIDAAKKAAIEAWLNSDGKVEVPGLEEIQDKWVESTKEVAGDYQDNGKYLWGKLDNDFSDAQIAEMLSGKKGSALDSLNDNGFDLKKVYHQDGTYHMKAGPMTEDTWIVSKDGKTTLFFNKGHIPTQAEQAAALAENFKGGEVMGVSEMADRIADQITLNPEQIAAETKANVAEITQEYTTDLEKVKELNPDAFAPNNTAAAAMAEKIALQTLLKGHAAEIAALPETYVNYAVQQLDAATPNVPEQVILEMLQNLRKEQFDLAS